MARARRRRETGSTAWRAASVLATCVLTGAGFWGTAGAAGTDGISDSVVYTANGTYTVPDGVTSLRFTVTGAGGGSSTTGLLPGDVIAEAGAPSDSTTTPGGAGGVESGLLSVEPGEVLTIVVGRAGSSGSSSADQADAGGFGGPGFGSGGNGGDAPQGLPSAGGGGGGSAILTGTTPLVVAGGGGGASASSLIGELGSPVNSFDPCQWQAVGGSVPPGSTPGWNVTSCPPDSNPPPTTFSWVDACPGLAPGAVPSERCPIGPVPPASPDGAPGVDAQSDPHLANPAGGGGGGGAVGGANGVPTTDSMTTGGGQGGANFVDASRTSEVTASTADNAGTGDDPTTFCKVTDHIDMAGDDPEPDPLICSTLGTPASDGAVTLTPISSTDATAPSIVVAASVSPDSTSASGPSPSTSTVPADVPTESAPSLPAQPEPVSTSNSDNPGTAVPRPPTVQGVTTRAPAAMPVPSTPTYTG